MQIAKDNRKCETCGNDTFQIRDILSEQVFDGMQILMGVLYTCAVCKNEEYESDL